MEARTAFENQNAEWKQLFGSQLNAPEILRSVQLLAELSPPRQDEESTARARRRLVGLEGGYQYEIAMNSKQETQKSTGFTDDERAAMKERAKEMKAEARANKSKAEGENEVLAKIAEMSEPDRVLATRLHEIIKASAPVLAPKTWYGMPAYAQNGKIVCFFQSAQKFNTRYATLGFGETANLDEGAMWPTAFALKALTPTEEAKIIALVKQATSDG